MLSWTLTSWRNFVYAQAATYPDKTKLDDIVEQLGQLPPLIDPAEIDQLKLAIAHAGRGEAFILQGGDCSESFKDGQAEVISNKLKILSQMSLVLEHGMQKPIICIGRIAGQYTKPRSSEYETLHGITLPSYRGDLVNSPLFTSKARIACPKLLLEGYRHAAITLHYIRAWLEKGFANFHHPEYWDLAFVKQSPQAAVYFSLVNAMSDTWAFLSAANDGFNKRAFFTSHEALHLYYEQALTRHVHQGKWYNLGTHLPWIGMRTANLDSAHVELLRGINNPIGLKLGPDITPQCLESLIKRLNPQGEEGRLLLITRLGAQKIETRLPILINTVKKTKIPVTWACDPMHGNTEMTLMGVKTRRFDTILLELKRTLQIHHQMGSHLGGVHFELTGENVTECLGGARGLVAADLTHAYQSLVDPRLNYDQSMEMAFQLSLAFKNQG